MNRRLLSIGLVFALAACGGGGGKSALPSTGGSSTGTQNVTVQFSVPRPTSAKAIARGRRYVSYSTNLAVVTYTPSGATFNEPVSGTSAPTNYVTDVSEATGSANTATNGKACVNTVPGGPARTCTITLAVPAGLYSVELSLWSGSFTDAHTPQGDELSASGHTVLAVGAGSTNAINFAVAGINAVVSSVYLLLDHSTVNWNTGAPVNLSIDLKDAEGNHIMSDGTGNGLVDPSGNPYTAHITLDTQSINGCIPAGTLANINGAAPPYNVSSPPSATVPITQNDACLYSLTVTSSDPPTGNSNSITNAQLQTSGVNQTYPTLTGISDARATTLDDQGRIWVFGVPTTPGAGGIERINADGSVTDFAAAMGDTPVNGVEGTDGNMYIVNNDANLTYLPVNAASGTAPVAVTLNLADAATAKLTAIARDSATGHLWMVEATDGDAYEVGGSPYAQIGPGYPVGFVGATAVDVQNNNVLVGDNNGLLWGFPTSNPFLNWSVGVSTGPVTGLSAFDSANEIVTSTVGFTIYKHTGNQNFAGTAASQVAGIRAKDGSMYFAGSSAIQQASFNGSSISNGSSYNNNYPSATFGNPTIDLNGNLWFAVNGTGSVMEFSPPANWSTGSGFTISTRHGH
ncbi:MAG TPA: hypothetical protein VFL13_08970 [Candidatus Baltobacteraceae bacterium]|nr:hypothetical protein [Candidatus Baltobacteraceae bacterium]